jgi:hypothetical protein
MNGLGKKGLFTGTTSPLIGCFLKIVKISWPVEPLLKLRALAIKSMKAINVDNA